MAKKTTEVTHSKNYEKVRKYYRNKLWSKYMVWCAVNRWITAEEYAEIVGEEWDSTQYEK